MVRAPGMARTPHALTYFSVHCSGRTIDAAYSPVEYGLSTFPTNTAYSIQTVFFSVFSQLNTAYRLSDTAAVLKFSYSMVLIAKGRLKKVMTKTMMKPTMEEYVTEVRGDYYSSITKTMINGKAAYELKGKFLDDLRNNAFSETNREDAVEHIESFLKIIDPLELPHISYERLGLVVFPISLTGDAKPWSEIGVPYELIDHICEPFRFMDGKTKWPTCSSNDDGFCSGGELPRMVRVGYMTYFQYYKWYDDLIDGNLKEETLKQKAMNERNDDEVIREEGKPNDNHGIGDFDNDLVGDNPPYHASEEEEQYEEARCELLGNPRQEPPVCKITRFEVKYSYGPAEKYIAIK
ncbi:hypothetical protein Tco_1438408 [Tanacetum coccineum]